MKKPTKKLRRVETKLDDDSIFLLIRHDNPVFFVHGAYSTENKLFAELKRLSKQPENKLTRKQKRLNSYIVKHPHCGRVPHADPMDAYQIWETQVQ